MTIMCLFLALFFSLALLVKSADAIFFDDDSTPKEIVLLLTATIACALLSFIFINT